MKNHQKDFQSPVSFPHCVDLVKSEQWKKKPKAAIVCSLWLRTATVYVHHCPDRLVLSFNLPFMKRTGLMENKSFPPCKNIEAAVFQSAALQGISSSTSSESLCSSLQRNTRGSFQNEMPKICSLLGYKAPFYACDEKFLKVLLSLSLLLLFLLC